MHSSNSLRNLIVSFDAKEEWSLVATSSLSSLSEKLILQQILPIYSCYKNSQLSKDEHNFYNYQPLIQNASTEQVQHVFANSFITLWTLKLEVMYKKNLEVSQLVDQKSKRNIEKGDSIRKIRHSA
jgi:hypothetical protein